MPAVQGSITPLSDELLTTNLFRFKLAEVCPDDAQVYWAVE
jgi:hypothetical protein